MSSLSTSESVLVKELFVSSKTPVQCHLTRAAKHLELDNSVLILNGLGKAINTTIDVALKLQEKFHNTIKLDIQTSTAEIKEREHADSLSESQFTYDRVPYGDEIKRRTHFCWSGACFLAEQNIDILEPLNEDDDYEARTRSLSSIHIKITK